MLPSRKNHGSTCPFFIVPILIAVIIYLQQVRHSVLYNRIDSIKSSNLAPFEHIRINLKTYVDNEIPVVVRNNNPYGHIFNWSALEPGTKWTRNYLSRKFGNEWFTGYNQHTHRLFMYYNEDRAMADLIPRRTEQVKEEHLNNEHAMLYSRIVSERITLNNFLKLYDNSNNDNSEPYIYLSNPLLNERLLQQIQPLNILEVTNTGKSVNLWIGGKRSTAQAHFDAFHNAFVQILGTKTFLLYPPDQWLYMYLYSRHHPSYRQSQLNFQEDDWNHLHKKYPLSSKLGKPYLVKLNPGDMLYLPPYWFHHVEASETLSISVNVWTDCRDADIYEEMLSHPIPFESDWGKEKKQQAAKIYLTIFLEQLIQNYPSVIPELKGIQTAKDYIQQVIIYSRYRYLFDENIVPSSMPCAKNDNSLKESIGKFTEYAELFIEKVNKLQPGIRDMLLGNYIEDFVLFILGDVKLVGAFLNSCFA